ncbi:MAG: DNA-J related domain-containing protein [Myxococcota bacterium]|nr:DNA-J related domain-containing protein [Myxococcota bacterium]
MILDASNLLHYELIEILEDQSGFISEYELLQILRERGHEELTINLALDSHALFRIHFVLFHALYNLREGLRLKGTQDLVISATKIGLTEPIKTEDALVIGTDSLREYYLDPSHLHETTAEDVDSMLTSFWEKYFGFDEVQHALGIMGLAQSASNRELKQQYHNLAMEFHPDRGGSPDKFKEITGAATTLQKYGLL